MSGSIIDYDIIETMGNSPIALIEQVKETIGKGWEPLGGVGVRTEGNLLQAMVKREEDDDGYGYR